MCEGPLVLRAIRVSPQHSNKFLSFKRLKAAFCDRARIAMPRKFPRKIARLAAESLPVPWKPDERKTLISPLQKSSAAGAWVMKNFAANYWTLRTRKRQKIAKFSLAKKFCLQKSRCI